MMLDCAAVASASHLVLVSSDRLSLLCYRLGNVVLCWSQFLSPLAAHTFDNKWLHVIKVIATHEKIAWLCPCLWQPKRIKLKTETNNNNNSNSNSNILRFKISTKWRLVFWLAADGTCHKSQQSQIDDSVLQPNACKVCFIYLLLQLTRTKMNRFVPLC